MNNSANQTQGLSQSIQGTLSAAKTKTVTVTKNKNSFNNGGINGSTGSGNPVNNTNSNNAGGTTARRLG